MSETVHSIRFSSDKTQSRSASTDVSTADNKAVGIFKVKLTALQEVLHFSCKPVDSVAQTFPAERVARVDLPGPVVDVIQPKSRSAACAVDCFAEVLLVGEKQDRNRLAFEVFVRQHQPQLISDDGQTQRI